MSEEELRRMKPGHLARINGNISILRVVGGWIYSFSDGMNIKIESSVFVPET